MFAQRGITGVAVILGAVSGFLAVRDFDCVESYEAWAAAHAALASRLPTVRTARGFHVYFRITEEAFQSFGGASGELRGDSKHIVVLPPSLHPDGPIYNWVVPLPDGELPVVDPQQAGLCNTEGAENTENAENRENRENPATKPLESPALSAPLCCRRLTEPSTRPSRQRRDSDTDASSSLPDISKASHPFAVRTLRRCVRLSNSGTSEHCCSSAHSRSWTPGQTLCRDGRGSVCLLVRA